VVHAAGTALAAGGRVTTAALADGRDALVAAGDGIRRFTASRFPLQAAVARGVATWWSQLGHCDAHAPAADGSGGSNHRVMIVAGIDSSITNGGPSSALPADKLGYEASEVSYYSYAQGGGDYTPTDTEASLATAARRLGEQLQELERREPGREVDLLAHSQGGVVVAEFLTHVYQPGDPSYPPLGTAVMMASPLGGATGATVFDGLRRSMAGRQALNAAHAAGLPNPNAESIAELSKHSEFMRAQRATRLPEMQLTTIGASQDVIAPAGDTERRGAQHYTAIPRGLNGHSSIVTDSSALRATRAALERKPLPCQSLATTLTGTLLSTAIATAEQRIGDAGAAALAGTGR